MVDNRGYAYVEHEREVNTYAELWHASEVVLRKGQAEHRGSAWQYLSSVVLSAFAFEAYLNHVGDAHFENWDDLERLGPMEKLRHLSLAFKVDLGSKGARPLQTLQELIRVRNVLAHGRSETLKPKPTLLPYDDPDFERHLTNEPTTFWEKRIREPTFALRVRQDLEQVLTLLHQALPDPKMPLFSFGFHTSGSRRA